ncbi:hypothetical protein M0812_25334 [Anaeramoeba flamelloides]|uniref:BSD domain-containing protein n=1 Tax=Anaeramoeba flamelloides TaxID=1746091 RepID=A0AAV7YGH1_9EUKA|nr:hypothetical protein M0812_25334 [Anaeramoeba flamelloides]
MTFFFKWFSKSKEQNNTNTPKHIVEKIEEVKNDLMGILDEENDITIDNESSGQDLEPTNLEKRAKHKIKKFQENLGSKEEEEKEKHKQKQRKKQEQKKNNSKTQTQKRQGFISFQDFKEQKDTETFKQQIKSLNKITNEDYDDDFDFSDSDSNSSSLNSDVSSSEEEEGTNNSLSQLRNKFSGLVNEGNSDSSESDPFSDESENSEKEDLKVKESLKAPNKNEDSEDDEFSDF